MSSAPILLHRPPLAIPPIHNNNDQIAYFFHPAYAQPHDLLFTLPCLDSPAKSDDGDESDASGSHHHHPKGLHHHTALLACQIIANNAFNSGQLYFNRQGTLAVLDQVPLQGLLSPGEYFFVVDSDPMYRYPIVPSFRDWRFPHGDIPAAWPSPKPAPSTDTARRCALTNHGYGLIKAHIIPREESEWFMQNGMSRYGVNKRDVNDSQNLIRLRADIHLSFDNRLFSIVPKDRFISIGPGTSPSVADASPVADLAYVIHVFGPHAGEFSGLYHNRPLQYLDNTSREFIFSRFAWTFLMLTKPFLLAGMQRSVVRCQSNQGTSVEWRAQDLSGHQLSNLYGGGGSRSASPKKRSRQREGDSGSVADSDGWDSETLDVPRGRKRVRRGSLGYCCAKNEITDGVSLSNGSESSATSTPCTPSPSSRPSPLECKHKQGDGFVGPMLG
ncbi:hypothetical protein CSAL01_11287 [Colletotrichum salicis]|uniref:HNH nuclease domain-containing protein n=1 Tax=Colletotrichum salicis TaxID=1209931 RepID=A0A135UW16_9PEZI|nr:hypothetical protein CSAL01_11287 [Colletotrichum salicis]